MKIGVWMRKTGFQIFFVEGKFMFWIGTKICRGQKFKILAKKAEHGQKDFLFFSENCKIYSFWKIGSIFLCGFLYLIIKKL